MNMLELRRRAIIASAGGSFVLPTYTGSYTLHGDETQGYIELLTDGTLTLAPWAYDLCLVGGGNNGGAGLIRGYNAYGNKYYYGAGGNGGAGGRVLNLALRKLGGDIACTVSGAGGNSVLGDWSSASGQNAGAGGSGATRDSASTQGGSGVNAFADANFPIVAGGGGGAGLGNSLASVGMNGGGNGGKERTGYNGTANTGGGGGGGGCETGNSVISSDITVYSGGAGGSGIILVRWGY